MKQIYISCSFSMQNELREATDRMKQEISTMGYQPFVFIEQYAFDITQEKEMMIQAMKDIDESCCLFAETTDKGIGIGIEAGYAKAQGKPVVYLRQTDASHSTTMSGMADYHILYDDIEDLGKQVKEVLLQIQLEVELRKYILDLVSEEKQIFTKEVLAYLKEYKLRGGGQERTIEVLTALGNTYDIVPQWRDKIDDVLDMVTGYCSPEWRVWGE
ncbi:nucleoside 2-deoxyribosyltransferase [Myroides odoratimimus]|uniref:nucleoside 2-deoxyribosyltransferase n=1 Tax=Myroides odoratimimus TaxID=76832 RepID=UPI000469E3D5|nr:nucleoside 2-deoxyribosyltransferase [Myroides odoratimimus]